MVNSTKAIYTCTPVAFHANDFFFIRDSGLISQSLRKLGVESKAIMPLPWHEDDRRDDVLRVEYAKLEDEAWWRTLRLDGVMLYSWGAPRYRRIARAIHQAGIRLAIHLDSSGNFYGLYPPGSRWHQKLFIQLKGLAQDYLRAKHLRYADVITMSASTAEHLRHRLFYGSDIAGKCYAMPCPVSPDCRYEGDRKYNQILCIGRWDDRYQKRPDVLMQTLDFYYAHGGDAVTLIYGRLTDALHQWHSRHPAKQSIRLMGNVPNGELQQAYKQSKILLCTSLYESSHIVSGEALCCGCSVVTPNRPEDLRCVLWYTTRDSGTISKEDTPSSLAEALQHELDEWANGRRNPTAIASAWQPHFHTDLVLPRIFDI